MYVKNVLGGGFIDLSLEEGKPPLKVLEKIISKYTGIYDPDVVKGPAIGEDAGIVRLGEGFLVAHVDPITTATRFIGWLAVNIAANDVAVRGVRPRWLLLTLLLPKGTSVNALENIMKDIDKAAKRIGVTIIGGHTEVTPGIPRPIIIATAIGHTRGRVVTSDGARIGDKVVVIGRIGGEGASIIAWDFEDLLKKAGVSRDIIEKAKELIYDVSVIEKALLIKDYVSSMHDPTEGGVLEALYELAIASGKTFSIDLDSIELDPIVEIITKAVNIDPYKLLSSGSLVATIPENYLEKVVSILKERNIPFSVCGEVVGNEPKLIVSKNNKKSIINESIIDEIYKLWR